MSARTPVEQNRELLVAFVLALISLSVAGCAMPFAGLVLFPAALVIALALPIIVRPRGLVAWTLGFVLALGHVFGLVLMIAALVPPGRALLGYAVLAMVGISASWIGVLWMRAPERLGHALRVALLMALSFPFTALVLGLLLVNGMPTGA